MTGGMELTVILFEAQPEAVPLFWNKPMEDRVSHTSEASVETEKGEAVEIDCTTLTL